MHFSSKKYAILLLGPDTRVCSFAYDAYNRYIDWFSYHNCVCGWFWKKYKRGAKSFFKMKIRVAITFFRKIRGAKTFFRKK